MLWEIDRHEPLSALPWDEAVARAEIQALARDAERAFSVDGAPGMITALSRLPAGDEIDALFAAAAELTWQAGPLIKGSGLCHGTAGNGYAFLAMRARRFAMHALEQSRAARAHYGRGRYSLWTGDLGVAMFLQDCIDGAGELPGLAYL